MKKRTLAALLCCLTLLFSFGTTLVAANGNTDTVKTQVYLDGILAYYGVTQESEIQSFIDGYVTEKAGNGSEWYVIALSQNGNYDFSAYENALLSYLKENKVVSATSRLKYALCLASVGSTDKYISVTINEAIGKQGLMSYVFGLHLLNNGYISESYTAEQVVERLLSMQIEDGGWAITGKVSDADATAMTIQALAPYYESNKAVGAAVDKALTLLSEMQQNDGDYQSYGVPNPESTSQVLMALCSLNVSAEDARFAKNGNTLFDGIEKYRLNDGSFCHRSGDGYNGMATSQSFLASVACIRSASGKGNVYILDKADPENVDQSPIISTETESFRTESTDTAAVIHVVSKRGDGYKLWLCIAILVMGIVACVILILLKKKSYKNFIAIGIISAVLIVGVCLTDLKTPEEYYGESGESKENAIGTVTLSIRCDKVAGREEHIPENGVILDTTELTVSEGDTVYSVLLEAAKANKIQLESNGSAYISGINYLYEFDYGDLSGWVYTVNGERASVGAGEYKLKDGDVIEWHYTLELGNDLK